MGTCEPFTAPLSAKPEAQARCYRYISLLLRGASASLWLQGPRVATRFVLSDDRKKFTAWGISFGPQGLPLPSLELWYIVEKMLVPDAVGGLTCRIGNRTGQAVITFNQAELIPTADR